jgi:hypothetical protein
MRLFHFSFAIDGPELEIKADNVFQARMKIVEKYHKEAYTVWEVRHV